MSRPIDPRAQVRRCVDGAKSSGGYFKDPPGRFVGRNSKPGGGKANADSNAPNHCEVQCNDAYADTISDPNTLKKRAISVACSNDTEGSNPSRPATKPLIFHTNLCFEAGFELCP